MGVQSKIAVVSIIAGGSVSIACFFSLVSAILLVGGDGSAPRFTYWALHLIAIPSSLFAASTPLPLILSSLFWGAATFIVVFVLLEVAQWLR